MKGVLPKRLSCNRLLDTLVVFMYYLSTNYLSLVSQKHFYPKIVPQFHSLSPKSTLIFDRFALCLVDAGDKIAQ